MKRRLLLSLPVVAAAAALAVGSAGAAVKPHDVTAGTAAKSSSWDSVRLQDVTAGLFDWGGKLRPDASSWS